MCARLLGGLVVFGALGWLSVGVFQDWHAETAMQAAADTAAHSAVFDLPDSSRAKETALAYAERNLPDGGMAIKREVVFGTWHTQSRRFQPDTKTLNAVKVQLRRRPSIGSRPLGAAGLPSPPGEAQATAFMRRCSEQQDCDEVVKLVD